MELSNHAYQAADRMHDFAWLNSYTALADFRKARGEGDRGKILAPGAAHRRGGVIDFGRR